MDVVIIRVMVLIINKKRLSVIIVIGSVKIIKSGLISMFKIDKMRLVIIVVLMLLIWMELMYLLMMINNNVFIKMLIVYFIMLFYIFF